MSAVPAEWSSPSGLYSNLTGNLYSSSLILILLIIFTRKHRVTVTKQRKSSSEVPFSHYRLSEKEAVSIYQFHACHRLWKTFPFFCCCFCLCFCWVSPPPLLPHPPLLLFSLHDSNGFISLVLPRVFWKFANPKYDKELLLYPGILIHSRSPGYKLVLFFKTLGTFSKHFLIFFCKQAKCN